MSWSSYGTSLVIGISQSIGYGLDEWGSFPDRGKDISLGYRVQSGPGEYPASYSVSIGATSMGVKRPGA